MSGPDLVATYRLQFREGMTFDRAAGLAPYLRDLGVSHLYASPIFQAAPGSTHGYDVTDPGAFDAELGGRAGFERMSDALRAAGLGLIVDIVPNHMAFTHEGPWMADLLRHGPESRYARHFDIDWSQGRLVLPVLGKPFAAMNAEGAFRVEEGAGEAVLAWEGMAVPLAAGTALEGEGPEAVARLHTAQHWRLTDWRLERDGLTHRRFFAVTSLIGVRVEDAGVFEDVHRLLFEMVAAGRIQGIRIDHVDGLADPVGYLDRLRDRVPGVPVWVEKILTGPEPLPDWAVVGTTGYEAAAEIARVLTAEPGLGAIDAGYRARLETPQDFEAMLLGAKRAFLQDQLAAELGALTRMAEALAAQDPLAQDFGPDTLRRTIVEICAAFPVYRTYLTDAPVSESDRTMLDRVAEAAAEHLCYRPPLDFLIGALTAQGTAASRFRMRLQQVTGALMAKSKEDTAFFRFVRLLSANEVGSEPEEMAMDAVAFHAAMAARRAAQPLCLTLTSSHDTKRSEDARMRIAAISHAPEDFIGFVARIEALEGAEAVPGPTRWYLCQTLLAMWDPASDMEGRLAAHMVKAMREANEGTGWLDPDEAFEARVLAFAARAVAACRALEAGPAPRVMETAGRLMLVQAALKLMMPGVPDIYQGCEVVDLSVTDPDNRRTVAFDAIGQGRVAEPEPEIARRKLSLTRACLALRWSDPALFLEGDYTPVPLPAGLIGFVRRLEGRAAGLVAQVEAEAPVGPLEAPQLAGLAPVWGMDAGALGLTREPVIIFGPGGSSA